MAFGGRIGIFAAAAGPLDDLARFIWRQAMAAGKGRQFMGVIGR
jgi:hypothetical protein